MCVLCGCNNTSIMWMLFQPLLVTWFVCRVTDCRPGESLLELANQQQQQQQPGVPFQKAKLDEEVCVK